MGLSTEINRNDVSLVFQQEELKRGKNKGATIMAPPKITKDNLQVVCKWIGDDELAAILYGRLRNMSSGWTESAEDTEGNFQLDAFNTFASKFSARGESMEELESQIDDLLAEMGQFAEAGDSAKVLECGVKIKSLKAEIESKKRPRKQKAEAVAA